MAKTKRPFGLWSSPIDPSAIAGSIRLSDLFWDSDGGRLVWLEERSGQGVLVCVEGNEAQRDLTDVHSVRASVGYGGGEFAVSHGHVYFVEKSSGRIYKQAISGGKARPITPEFGKASSPAVSPDGRWVIYVHSVDRIDRIGIVDSDGKLWPQILVEGADFYMQPRWSPTGRNVAWVSWNHPNMPWDGTRLEVCDVEYPDGDGLPKIGTLRTVAGGEEEAIFQPEFTPDGRSIVYITDASGWGRLAVTDLESNALTSIGEEGAEFGRPAWIQGERSYALTPDGERAVVGISRKGFTTASVVDLATGAVAPIVALDEYTDVSKPAIDPTSGTVSAIVSSSQVTPRLVVVSSDHSTVRVVRRTTTENVVADGLSVPEPYNWETIGGETVYGLYYPPASTEFTSDGVPPLIVHVHGGPTSHAYAGYSAQIQFLATRGYAVLSVNYRGSTGYGREYMNLLRGNWGVFDVHDSVSGAQALAAAGRVDGTRTAIMGGSAGGFTVLQTMIDYPDAFSAGVCLYGVANQFTLADETHKFEERYTDSLLGPLPEAAAVYRQRSPQFRASEIRRPLAIFQGEIDQVVPKNQSDTIVEALRRTGTPVEYHVYEGEGHGWRKRETIDAFYRALEKFLRRNLIFS